MHCFYMRQMPLVQDIDKYSGITQLISREIQW